ncbi:MAG: AraC family transcriptional regulator [Defluviitaleaceae bacterium]|nr:AraC family transcriptional regulator [Defluviitaleaceae bacterium]
MNSYDFDNAVPCIDYFSYRKDTYGWRIEPSITDFVDMTYIIGGDAVYIINDEKIAVSAGDLLCIPKQSSRSAISHTAEMLECFAVNFNMYGLELGTGNNDVNIPLPLVASVGIHEGIISLFKRLNENWLRRGPGYTMRVRAYFMLILQRFFEMLLYEVDTSRFDARIKATIRYITNNFTEPVCITDAAKEVHLTPNYLGILFKQEVGTTFRDYLNTIRLNQAEDMLRAGDGSITEIALKCGFKDVFYFSRLFKKYKGATPSSVQS